MKKPLFLQPFTQTKSRCVSSKREEEHSSEPACGTEAPRPKTNTRNQMNTYVHPQRLRTTKHTVVVTGSSPDITGTPGKLLLMYSLTKKKKKKENGLPFMGAHLILL